MPVELDLPVERRLPDHLEVAAYYAVSAALANAAKHARASAVHVELDTPETVVRLAIRDDGIGGADPTHGSGLVGLSDRIKAVGGTLEMISPTGGGTTLLIEIPVQRRHAGKAETRPGCTRRLRVPGSIRKTPRGLVPIGDGR